MNEESLAELPISGQSPEKPHIEVGPQGLLCTVCSKPISVYRVRKRSVTCSDECMKAMRKHRIDLAAKVRCPHCYQPNTPAERDEFKAWRASKGPIQTPIRPPRPGNPHHHGKELAKALEEALEVVREQRDELWSSYAVKGDISNASEDERRRYYALVEKIRRFEAILAKRKKNVDMEAAV